MHVLVAMNILVLPLPLAQARWLLDRVEFFIWEPTSWLARWRCTTLTFAPAMRC